MKITVPGIYREFDGEAYFADPTPAPSLSQSVAKVLIEHSPLHARQEHPKLAQPIDGDDDDGAEKYVKAKAIGNAAHAIMLGRGKKIWAVDHKDFTGKEAKEEKKAAIAAGAEPVLAKHIAIAEALVKAGRLQLAQTPDCDHAFNPATGAGEVVLANVENGMWLRQLVDWITNDLREVWDFKTTGLSASPYAAGKMMGDAGWNIQAAMSDRILAEIDPEGAGRRRYMFVCQEQYAPFEITVSEVDGAALMIGHKQLDYAVDRWRDAMTSGNWPGYPRKIIRPSLPDWSVNRWIEREALEYDDRQDFDPRNLLAG